MKFLLTALLVFGFAFSHAQDTENLKVYKSMKKAKRNKKKVELLVLAGQNLDAFPMEILEMKNLKVLNLTNNNISFIPEGISQLTKLERLEMLKNDLKSLPSSIYQMSGLKRINVAYNELSKNDVAELIEAIPDCEVVINVGL